MNKITGMMLAATLSFGLAACGGSGAAQIRSEASVIKAGGEVSTMAAEEENLKMNVQVGDARFTATLEDNEAAAALIRMMENAPVVISMSDYSGFEKVGSLGTELPASNRQMTAQAGDIVLYNGNQIVIFYGSNSWSYTKLGRIDDLTGWSEALGNGDVTVTFSVDQVQNPDGKA